MTHPGSMLTGQSPVQFDDPLPREVDVAVVGGGVIGVSTAWFLAGRGQRVALVEKGRVGAEQSRRNWGWIRKHGRDRAELPIVIESIGHWRTMAAEVGEDIGFAERGVTYLAANETELAAREAWLGVAREFGLDTRMLNRREVDALLGTDRHGWIGAACTPSDACAEPFVAVPAIAREVRRRGVTITESCAARTIEREAGAVSALVTERGTLRCRAVVCAGGAWTSLFTRHLGCDFPQLTVRATVARTAPVAEFYGGNAASSGLAFRRRADGGYTLAPGGSFDHYVGRETLRHARRFLPSLLRSHRDFSLRFGGGLLERLRAMPAWDGASTSPFERVRVLNPEPSAAALASLQRAVAAELPALRDVPIAEAWAGMIDATPDVVPVIDQVSAIPGLHVAAGFSGHGFGIGPGAGRVMADMVLGNPPGHDMRRFRFDRFRDGSPLELGPAL